MAGYVTAGGRGVVYVIGLAVVVSGTISHMEAHSHLETSLFYIIAFISSTFAVHLCDTNENSSPGWQFVVYSAPWTQNENEERQFDAFKGPVGLSAQRSSEKEFLILLKQARIQHIAIKTYFQQTCHDRRSQAALAVEPEEDSLEHHGPSFHTLPDSRTLTNGSSQHNLRKNNFSG